MITVKITNVGGYVYGDGQLPPGFDANAFMKAFMGRIITARAQGLTEIGFTDQEVADYITESIACCAQEFDKGTTIHVPDTMPLLEAITMGGI